MTSYLMILIQATILCSILMPLVRKIGIKYKVYAEINQRAVHTKKMVRIGGVASYLSFMLVCLLNNLFTSEFSSIIIGGSVIFIEGFLDDLLNIKPLVKGVIQIIIAIYVSLSFHFDLNELNLFGLQLSLHSIPFIDGKLITTLISIFWIIGLCNAFNLIDGLDGLCAGVSLIVLFCLSFIVYTMGKYELLALQVCLIGTLIGTLFYNFHPAKIFIGDCGSQFIGFMIACISLMGFKKSTMISLTIPLIITIIPILDTVIAMLRRLLKGQSITHADREHLHHILMYKLGFSHRNTVLIIYLICILFSISSLLIFYGIPAGKFSFIILMFITYLFVELTGIVSVNYHPLMHICRIIFKHPKKSEKAIFQANKLENHHQNNKK